MLTILIPEISYLDTEEFHKFVSVPMALTYAVTSNPCNRLSEEECVLNILDVFQDEGIDPKEELHAFDMVKGFSIWLYTRQILARQQQHLWREINYYDL
ncbi:hypothetical protein IFR05_012008 [Cadophora sp. M221]|nr:hypothetical protein IFR05_012008 [Cadophora sp. M221]